MTSALKRALRAAEYRGLASAAAAMAESCALANVRDVHERAAAQWTALAVLDERPRDVGRAWAGLEKSAPVAEAVAQS